MSQTIESGIVDLSDARAFLDAAPARKLWMIVFLMAVRDRAEMIRFADGKVVCLSYVIGGKEYELVHPSPGLAGRLVEVVHRRLESDPGSNRRSSRLGRLTRKLFPRNGPKGNGEGVALPWSSNFRLRLGDGLADVAATARAEGDGRVLTLDLSNVTITPAAAAEWLGLLMAERRTRKAASAVRSPVGPGTSG